MGDLMSREIKKFDSNNLISYSLLNVVMDSMDECIVYVNTEGIIEMMSEAYCEFLNIKKEDAVGKHVTEVIENTRMHLVTQSGNKEIAQVQEIMGRKMIADRIPVYVDDKLVGAVGRVLFKDVNELTRLHNKINTMESKLNLYQEEFKNINKAKYNLNNIIGDSMIMLKLKNNIKKIARTNSNVLITGESGTGKELFAHAVHNESIRADMPFVSVNCGAIPYDLMESELFGYEKGAFTGAKKGGKIGKFKAADGGTIFLDEIAELPLKMQVKLLRVLQDHEIEKVGSNIKEKVNIRVIAATNKNIDELVKKGEFRLDLFYRLSVVNLKIPPLRDRNGDIRLLVNYLINKISNKEGIRVDGIKENALKSLETYEWPGNVRELENTIEQALNFLDNEKVIKLIHLPPRISGVKQSREVKDLKSVLEEAEKDALIQVLRTTDDNKTKTAKILGVSRTTLYEKMNKYGLS